LVKVDEMTRRKVADFPSEFLQAWELASRGLLELSFPTKGKAMNFRQQLHAFRKEFLRENGQAACALWFTYDLVVEPDQSLGSSNSAEVHSWLIKCSKLDWKNQVNSQAKAEGLSLPTLPPPQIIAPSPLIPPGIPRDPMWGQTPDGKPLLNTGPVHVPTHEENEAAKDALSRGLEKLGFGSKQ
jgi:hypothetical protein